MAITYEINTEQKNIRVTATGELSPDELVDLHHRVAGTPEVQEDFSILLDLRGAQASSESFSADSIRALAALPNLLAPASRRAIVVCSDFGFGIARMYGLRRGDRMTAFGVFRDLDEAERWIEGG